jgi:hypothetical protein
MGATAESIALENTFVSHSSFWSLQAAKFSNTIGSPRGEWLGPQVDNL